MNKKFYSLFLLLAAVGLLTAVVAGPVYGGNVDPTEGFRALSGSAAHSFDLPDDVELVRQLELHGYGLTYLRYQQFYGEAHAEVLGGQLTLYQDGDGNTVTVIGNYYPEINATNANKRSKDNARSDAARDIGPDGTVTVDLMINPDSGRYFHRVETQRMDTRWFHWLDADSGNVMNKYDGIATDCVTLVDDAPCGFGVAYDGGDGSDVKDLSGLTSSAGSQFKLVSQDGRQETHDQGSTNKPFLGPIATDDDDLWVLPGNVSPAQPALVDGHYYARVADDYFMTTYGFDWVDAGIADTNNTVNKMVIHAHFSKNYANAYWNGSYIALGDGDQVSFGELTSLDVVGHELTHGVTEFTSGLIYQNESGALNESFSDIMGSAMEQYAEDNSKEPATTREPDWFIGEDFDLRGDTVPGFRNMANPQEDGDPDHYSERYTGTSDSGGVHTNSAISNHAFYLLAQPIGETNSNAGEALDHGHIGPVVTGIGLAAAEEIFFLAYIGLDSNADMTAAHVATEAAATTLFGSASQQATSTTDAWCAVGVGASCGASVATGSISGTVTAADGGVAISGANVQTDTGQATTTGGDGAYLLTGVPTGSRTVTASATGFTNGINGSVQVSENPPTIDVDFSLVAAPAGDYSVGSMDLHSDKKGPWYNLTAAITLSPNDGGVTVASTFIRTVDGTTFSFSGPTDGSGSVSFKLKTQAFGEYEVKVNGAGSSSNPVPGESCKKITINADGTFPPPTAC